MYGINNSGRLFYDELTEWLLEAGFIKSQYQMSIYYKYAPDGTNIFVISYVDDGVYLYAYEALGKCFVYTMGKIFHMNFLGYSHWFMSIRIYHMEERSISVDQAKYDTSIVAKYLDNATFKIIAKFYKHTLPSDMIFTNTDASTSDEQVEKLSRELNIYYRSCIGSLIYLLSTGVYLSFVVHKIRNI